MNGSQRVVRSTETGKETGNIWGFSFSPKPDKQFMADFDWRVLDAQGDALWTFSAYMMRDLDNGLKLNMRFRDLGDKPVGNDAKLIVELRSPSL